jgi:DNA polymerase-3 subunit delta'
VPILRDVRGQDRAVAVLRRALSGDRVPHAYLFAGPARSGKYTTGLALAAAMNCLQVPGEGCGACEACSKIDGGIHPDVITLEREGAAQIIPIESIRKAVLARVGLPPHEGRARVYLIEEAGALQGPAANALLKTLEEPPARTHFVVITTAPDQLLPTILSRCQRVPFLALPPDLRAELAHDDEGAARLEEMVDRLQAAVQRGDSLALGQAAAEVTQDKTDTAPVLQLLAVRLHQRARAAAIDGDLPVAAALARSARAVLETEMTVALHNAHGQLAFDDLLRQLRNAGAGLAPRSG